MAMTAATVPMNAPPLITPIAVPNRRAGLDVRAMSKVITAVIVGAGTASTSTTSSQIGAWPGHSSTVAQITMITLRTPIAIGLR